MDGTSPHFRTRYGFFFGGEHIVVLVKFKIAVDEFFGCVDEDADCINRWNGLYFSSFDCLPVGFWVIYTFGLEWILRPTWRVRRPLSVNKYRCVEFASTARLNRRWLRMGLVTDSIAVWSVTTHWTCRSTACFNFVSIAQLAAFTILLVRSRSASMNLARWKFFGFGSIMAKHCNSGQLTITRSHEIELRCPWNLQRHHQKSAN